MFERIGCQRDGCKARGAYSPKLSIKLVNEKTGEQKEMPMYFDLAACLEHATPEAADAFLTNQIKAIGYNMADQMGARTLTDNSFEAKWVPHEEAQLFFAKLKEQDNIAKVVVPATGII